MLSVGFEPAISAIKCFQTYISDNAAIGTVTKTVL